MANYIPGTNAFKKRGILKKREETLRHAIRHDFPEPKLLLAAENVRAAWLAVIRCLRVEKEYCHTDREDKMSRLHLHLAEDSERWERMAPAAIIDFYRTDDGHSGG